MCDVTGSKQRYVEWMIVVDVSEYEMLEVYPSILICEFMVASEIGFGEFDNSNRQENRTHDVALRVFGRTDLKREAGEGPALRTKSLVPVVQQRQCLNLTFVHSDRHPERRPPQYVRLYPAGEECPIRICCAIKVSMRRTVLWVAYPGGRSSHIRRWQYYFGHLRMDPTARLGKRPHIR